MKFMIYYAFPSELDNFSWFVVLVTILWYDNLNMWPSSFIAQSKRYSEILFFSLILISQYDWFNQLTRKNHVWLVSQVHMKNETKSRSSEMNLRFLDLPISYPDLNKDCKKFSKEEYILLTILPQSHDHPSQILFSTTIKSQHLISLIMIKIIFTKTHIYIYIVWQTFLYQASSWYKRRTRNIQDSSL